ncbi:NAD(P)/FAD-dependent oxidoreductase [Streptomyces sp. MMS24-I31]|uniref:NAD(P)/FAD-dependent oxidoreductase n=1 Tax=Streptomyces sp. MMS24-I31 TaxID=3351563 RepID=UPI003896BC15
MTRTGAAAGNKEDVVYDVIVVGARVAGASTAMLLARAGYRVLMVDRDRVVRDALSTLYIHQPGVAALHRWNVLPEVVATGCPPLERIRHTAGHTVLEGTPCRTDGVPAAYAPRRRLLDPILIRAAVDAGVEYRPNTSVNDLLFEDGRVVGVRTGSVRGDAEHIERARLVVGADGMHSTVAARVRAPVLLQDPHHTCVYYTYWSGLPPRLRTFEAPGRWVATIPTNDGATLVAAYFRQELFTAVRGDAPNALLGQVEKTAPEVREEMAAGHRLEHVHGTGDQRNFFREAQGPGWVLVGDAGHHKDSITAQGITDAFCQAQLLADCVGDGLQDPESLSTALKRFAEQRLDALLPAYRGTLKEARMESRVPRTDVPLGMEIDQELAIP